MRSTGASHLCLEFTREISLTHEAGHVARLGQFPSRGGEGIIARRLRLTTFAPLSCLSRFLCLSRRAESREGTTRAQIDLIPAAERSTIRGVVGSPLNFSSVPRETLVNVLVMCASMYARYNEARLCEYLCQVHAQYQLCSDMS